MTTRTQPTTNQLLSPRAHQNTTGTPRGAFTPQLYQPIPLPKPIQPHKYSSLLNQTWRKLQDQQRVKELDKAPKVVELKVIEKERRHWRREVSRLEREINELRERYEAEKTPVTTPQKKFSSGGALDESGTPINGNLADSSEFDDVMSPRSYAMELREVKKMARDAMEQCAITLQEQEREATVRVQKAETEIEKLVRENMSQRERITVAETTMQSLMDEVLGLRENMTQAKEQQQQLTQQNTELIDLNDRLKVRIERAEETIDEFFNKYQDALRLLKQKDEDYARRVEEAQRLNQQLELATQEAAENLKKFHERHEDRLNDADETIAQFAQQNDESVSDLMEGREEQRLEKAQEVLGENAFQDNTELHQDLEEATEAVREDANVEQTEPVLAQFEEEDVVSKTEQVVVEEEYYEDQIAPREEENAHLENELAEVVPVTEDEHGQQEPVLADNVEEQAAAPVQQEPVDEELATFEDEDQGNAEFKENDNEEINGELDLDAYDPGSLPPLPQ